MINGERLSRAEEKHLKAVQSKIEYCLYCQPYDDGEAFWILGEKTELSDVFYQCNTPEKYWKKITENLYCPNCGNESFDMGSEVGLKSKFEKKVEEHVDEARALYGNQVIGLEKLLEEHPLLAFQNKLAQTIYKEVKNKKLPIITARGNFFRSRKVEGSEIIPREEMYTPPLGKPLEGRFNHAGQCHLYLSNEKSTALKEVAEENKPVLAWCQEFEILEPVNDILDLSFDWSELTPLTSTLLLSLKLFNTIGRNDRNKENWRPDYYLTRYIMDCAKNCGYNGIKYDSSKDSSSFNLVLFHLNRISIKAIGNPTVEIFLNKDEKKRFISDLLN